MLNRVLSSEHRRSKTRRKSSDWPARPNVCARTNGSGSSAGAGEAGEDEATATAASGALASGAPLAPAFAARRPPP